MALVPPEVVTNNTPVVIAVNPDGSSIAAGGIPNGTTQLNASSGNVANAAAVATLAAAAGKTTFITGFEVTAGGATAGALVNVTVAGLIGGTDTYTFAVPTGATLAAQPLIVEFPEPIAASAVNTAIVVTLPAVGAGSTNAAVSAHGYQQ